MATSNSTSEPKQCSKCGSWKPHTNQYFRVRNGFTEKKCRECLNAYRNSLRRTETTKTYYRTDAEGYKVCRACGKRKHRATEFHKGNVSDCKDCRNASNRIVTKTPENRVKRAAQARTWRANNKGRNRENQRVWRLNNPEKELQKQAKYKQSNPGRFLLNKRATEARRRARAKAVGGTFTRQDIELLYRSQKGLCWWCGKPVEGAFEVDHRIPLARGGSNAPENLCISCPTCNSQKHDKLPSEWIGRLL